MEQPGRNLGERYELVQLIASGGMGQVWRGTDVLLGRPVAVKVLRSEYTGDPTFLARFRAEAHHAAALSHPNIAAVFDYGEVAARDGSGETLAYLVMELVEGEPLSAVLRRRGRLDAATTLSILEQAASALADSHRAGLVHRDVKPGNMLIGSDGRVKITDFGIAWSARSVPLTRTGQVIGTPQYLSPEQAEGHLATPASDVYALGLVGYECLTGHPAFDGDNAVTIALKQVRDDPDPLPDDLPREVRTLIRRAVAKEPAVRMSDGAAFVAAIADVRAGRPQPEPPLTRPVFAVGTPTGRRSATTAPEVDRGPTAGPLRPFRPRMAAVLVPLLALLLGAGAAAAVFAAVGTGRPPTAEAAQTRDGEGVVLDAGDYLGRPVDEVALQLASLGLTVQRQAEVTADSPPGTVTAVDPTGKRLAPGNLVLVGFAVAPEEPPIPQPGPAPGTGGPAGDQGAAVANEPPTSAAPSPPASTPTPGASAGTPSSTATAEAEPSTASPTLTGRPTLPISPPPWFPIPSSPWLTGSMAASSASDPPED